MDQAKREKVPDLGAVDDAARDLRSRSMDLMAEAVVHTQRLGDAAVELLGIDPSSEDLRREASELGSDIYRLAIAELDIITRALERSQRLVGCVLDARLGACERPSLLILNASSEKPAEEVLRVRSRAVAKQAVKVEIECRDKSGRPTTDALDHAIGRPELEPGQETSVRIRSSKPNADASPYSGTIKVVLAGGTVLLSRDFELWVRP